jgi:predicted Zn finger-like uncharacterized protein
MAINAVCPECRAEYNLADQQRGKKVRCKHCDAVFVAGAALAKKTAEAEEVVEVVERPAAKPKPTAVTARRGAPTKVLRHAAEDDADDSDDADLQPKRGKGSKGGGSPLPWIIGGGVVGVAAIAGLIVTLVMVLRDPPAKTASNGDTPQQQVAGGPGQIPGQVPFAGPPGVNPPRGNPPIGQPVEGNPVVQPGVQPPKTDTVPAKADTDPGPALPTSGRLTAEAMKRVKRATVYIEVTTPDGTRASGSGFFGAVEARNIILTNAHVVGMLAPESMRPKLIEVVVNSGQSDEWKTTARVLGVDRVSDLAVLDIGTPPKPLPEPLKVKPAGGLQELDPVYVFGFPLGKQLGKAITIRDSTVSALRTNEKTGVLERVQVNGGMDPGNSGGPVVDTSGAVVGVAVSGYEGRQINFAVPGERVQAILEGRISQLGIHQPYYKGGRVAIPVVMEMIDPRNRIKEVALEVWTGDKPKKSQPASRPPATTQPGKQAGDSERKRFPLTYVGGEGKGDIVLPDLPSGKVWWQQPTWVDAKGQSHWAGAGVLDLPAAPVERKATKLVLKYPPRAVRPVTLTLENKLGLSGDKDADAFMMKTEVVFKESVVQTSASGSTLSLEYRDKSRIKRDIFEPRKPPQPSKLLASVRDYLPGMITLLQIDSVGNITGQALDHRGQINDPRLREALKAFHQPIQQGLEAMAVSLPPKGDVNPLQSWKADRQLPIDTPGKFETGKLEMTFTYLGVRKYRGREEAVLSIDGMVRTEKDVADAIGGKASGMVLVDVETGQTRLAEVKVITDLNALVTEPGEPPRQLKVLATVKVSLKRDL